MTLPVAEHEPSEATTADAQASLVRRFEPSPPSVSHERILRIQGYADPERVRPAISAAAQAMARHAESLCRSEVAYQYRALRATSRDAIDLSHGGRLHSEAFAPRLAGCTEVVPFVLTCGLPIAQSVIELADRGDLLEAVLLESAGWLCIEDATHQFKAMLRRDAADRGCRITSRMGPGYSYRIGEQQLEWPLEDQPRLFGLFGRAPLPVELMASCAMAPKLSRSGLYGVAPLHVSPPQVGRPGPLN
jgi:hypothetical protein